VRFFLAEWKGSFTDNLPRSLGRLRRELGLPEAMLARGDGGGLLIVASADSPLTQERIVQALRRAIPLPDSPPEHFSVLENEDACKMFLMYVSGLADAQVASEEGYLASTNARAVGPAITNLFSAGLLLGRKADAYLELKRRDSSPNAFVIELARKIFGDLSRIDIYLLGCAPSAVAMAEALRDQACTSMLVTSADPKACTEATRNLPAKYSPPELAPDKVSSADMVICSEPECCQSLKALHFAIACSRRHGVPLLVLDVSGEGCIGSTIAKLDGVIVYRQDQLAAELAARQKAWAQELVRGADMVQEAAHDFITQIQHDSADKAIEAVHSLGERIARKELLGLQPTLERLCDRDRKTVADTIRRATRRAVSALSRATVSSSSRADLISTLKQAAEEGTKDRPGTAEHEHPRR